jgi:shikimate dehydrogenase
LLYLMMGYHGFCVKHYELIRGVMSRLDGATRLHFVVGDPIAQVKSPYGLTTAFQAKGLNAICVPLHIAAESFQRCLAELSNARNVDGLIVTVPHKFSAARFCTTLSPRASFLGAANTLRRNADGSWHGDMFDGLGWVQAMQRKGISPLGKNALLIGAGGAGGAIAHALVEAGVSCLAIHDNDIDRRNQLIDRLTTLKLAQIRVGSTNPHGYDIVANATPLGMKPQDTVPLSLGLLDATAHVGDVITVPEVTPLLAFAKSIGCSTQSGVDMFSCVKDLMVRFLAQED